MTDDNQQATNLLRPHAEQLHAAELEALARTDTGARPPNWRLSPSAVVTYLVGGTAGDGTVITPKYIGPRRIMEVAVATLATDRALLLLGVPGTAKTWVSEHLSAAISGTSTLLVQGTAGTPEEAIRYGWNYARLIAEGPSREALVASPIMMLTALLIKLESPGPVFYVQERMGLDAKPFPMLKFRSMRADAERNGPGWTVKNDPRRTRFGALIRRISFDELPQFINVLVGDMSLVGPRPERPVYVEQFRQRIPRYMDRHREKAGITGWAQVNGLRGDTSVVERTKYDVWYIENWSLALDFKIIIQTILNAARRNNNAY